MIVCNPAPAWSFGLIVAVGLVLAMATVWLFLTNPVTVAESVNEGDVSPFIRNLASDIRGPAGSC